MRRHEVRTAAGGPGYAGKPRPVLILQDHRISNLLSITTCGFTSDQTDAHDLRPLIAATGQNGLMHDSHAMIDKIMTFSRSCLGRRIGSLEEEDSAAIERAVLLFFGLAT